jgi:hypothetical protein
VILRELLVRCTELIAKDEANADAPVFLARGVADDGEQASYRALALDDVRTAQVVARPGAPAEVLRDEPSDLPNAVVLWPT